MTAGDRLALNAYQPANLGLRRTIAPVMVAALFACTMEGAMPAVDPVKAAQAHVIDLHVAARIRKLRVKRELTCDEVGRHLNVTGEQVRKYESGANRITAGKLAQLARLFNVRIGSLYQGMPGH